MKKILSIVLAMVLMLSMSVSALAVESAVTQARPPLGEPEFFDVISSKTTRSTSIPKNFRDLKKGSYTAKLEEVGSSVLYTNYYFAPNNENEIYVDYNVISLGSVVKMKIVCYDITSKAIVKDWTTPSFSAAENEIGSMYFYNLDATHKYAIGFIPVRVEGQFSKIKGSAEVSH